MTRREAIIIIYRIIREEVLGPEDEMDLAELADVICEDELEPCGPAERDEYCGDCDHLRPY